jgi:hypothetical protein
MLELLRRAWTLLGFLLSKIFRPRQLSESEVVTAYIAAGACYGDACTYPGAVAGKIGGRSARKAWGILEKEYAALGYRTIPIKDLINYGGSGTELGHLVRANRDEGEKALLWEPSTAGPTPMEEGPLDRLAAIDQPRRCAECRRELLDDERVHCSWCLRPILRGSFKNPLAERVREKFCDSPA